VIGVASDGAGGAEAALCKASYTEVNSLTNVAKGISTMRERVGKCYGGFLFKLLL